MASKVSVILVSCVSLSVKLYVNEITGNSFSYSRERFAASGLWDL